MAIDPGPRPSQTLTEPLMLAIARRVEISCMPDSAYVPQSI